MVYKLTNQNGLIEENAYIVVQEGATECVLIDCGTDRALIDSTLNKLGLTVKAVLLTHAHFDHALLGKYYQQKGAKIYIHALDNSALSTKHNLAKYFGVEMEAFGANATFEDGDVISEAGLTFEVLWTPGHSYGSSCFICESENAIFTGDTLFLGSIGRTDFLDSKPQLMKQSLKKLFNLNKDYIVYSGHGDSTTIFYERDYNIYND